MRKTIEAFLIGALLVALLVGLFKVIYNHTSTSQKPEHTSSELANPASVNCREKGGTLVIKKRGDGGEYGVCMFEDNRECEEWALYRGECPVGGINTIGYDTPAEVYCAITGGRLLLRMPPVPSQITLSVQQSLTTMEHAGRHPQFVSGVLDWAC